MADGDGKFYVVTSSCGHISFEAKTAAADGSMVYCAKCGKFVSQKATLSMASPDEDGQAMVEWALVTCAVAIVAVVVVAGLVGFDVSRMLGAIARAT